MRVLILSINKNLYSTKRLVEELKSKGHEVEVVNPLLCFMEISAGKPIVHYRKRKLTDIDIVIPRIGASVSSYGMAVVRQFEMNGILCLNSSDAIARARDKLFSLQLLSKQNLPLPKTSFANSTQQTDKLISLVGGAPTVVKLLSGSQGRGVVLGETTKASESLIEAFRELHANFLVQEFVKDASGRDIRCFVVGDKVIASMMRIAKEGEFRSNIHRGGVGVDIKITPEERAIAISAAKALDLNMAGVDIIRSGTGPKILEVNSSPGLEGIEGATKKNIAKEIAVYAEKLFALNKKNKLNKKGK